MDKSSSCESIVASRRGSEAALGCLAASYTNIDPAGGKRFAVLECGVFAPLLVFREEKEEKRCKNTALQNYWLLARFIFSGRGLRNPDGMSRSCRPLAPFLRNAHTDSLAGGM